MSNVGSFNLDSQPTGTAILAPNSLSDNIDSAFADSVEHASHSPKTCSVRGCKRKVTPDASTKMCEVCRGRHRIYATTKRARRKLEKAAVTGMRRMSEQLDNGVNASTSAGVIEETNPDPGTVAPNAENSGWISTQVPAPATAASTSWDDTAIDPQLFSPPVSAPTSSAGAQNPINCMGLHIPSYPPVPYVSSTSSELAGALTLPVPASTTSTNTVDHPKNDTSYYRPRLPDGTLMQPDPTSSNTSSVSGKSVKKANRSYYRRRPSPSKSEEQEDEESENQTENGHENENEILNTHTGDSLADATMTDTHDPGLSADGPTRFCSVKGCKAVIPSSYGFKMCPPCRVRYRTYGITKRAKWKAEREAFDRELAELRSKEDERRKIVGECPLSESPEELHAWELSILDEEVPLPPELLSMVADAPFPVAMYPIPSGEAPHFNGVDSNQSGSGEVSTMNVPSNVVMMHPTNATDTPHSVSPYPHLNYPLVAPNMLPARMCTVSHCHKMLPGLYRYKRCEQHRLQNRYHSKLKRVRERVVKAAGPTGECLEVDEEGEEGEMKDKEGKQGKQKKTRRKQGKQNKEGGEGEVGAGGSDPEKSPVELGENGGKEDEEKKPRKRAFGCTSEGCYNLLSPEVRWRNCESCRAKESVVRREKRAGERAAAKEVEQLRELVRAMEAKNGVPDVEMETQAGASGAEADKAEDAGEVAEDEDTSGEEQGDPDENEDADGDVDMTNVEGEPDVVSNEAAESSNTSPGQPTLVAPVPTPSAGSELNMAPMTISSGSKGGTYHSIIRTTAVPISFSSTTEEAQNDEANVAKTAGDSTNTTSPTILTANLGDADGLTFKAYQPKTASSTVGRLLAKNPDLSVQVFKDLLGPKDKHANNGLVGPSSYLVYQSSPPAPPSPAREPPVFVPTVPRTPPFVYQPPAKKARTNSSENRQMQETQMPGQNENVETLPPDPVASGSETTLPPPAAASTTTGATATTATKRKRPSRAAPKPQPPPQPPVPAYPYSNVPPSQYPYPYYVSPYGIPAYGMPPPQTPAPSSSTPVASSSAVRQSSPPQYPYYYSYPQPYGPPPPGYIYAPPGYSHAAYNQAQQQPQPLYAQQFPQPSTYPFPYSYPKDAEYSYTLEPPRPPQPNEYSFVVPRQRRPRRTRVDLPAVANKNTADAATPHPATPGDTQDVAGNGVTPMTGTGTGNTHATGNIGNAENDTIMPNTPAPGEIRTILETNGVQSRTCANKTCSRTIAAVVAGALCEKCRSRLKKHQAKAKQRFKLEPRKSVLGIVKGLMNDGEKDRVVESATVANGDGGVANVIPV